MALVFSCQELPDLEELHKLDPDAKIVFFNLRLDTLRGDLGLPAFPPKVMDDRPNTTAASSLFWWWRGCYLVVMGGGGVCYYCCGWWFHASALFKILAPAITIQSARSLSDKVK